MAGKAKDETTDNTDSAESKGPPAAKPAAAAKGTAKGAPAPGTPITVTLRDGTEHAGQITGGPVGKRIYTEGTAKRYTSAYVGCLRAVYRDGGRWRDTFVTEGAPRELSDEDGGGWIPGYALIGE